MKTALPLHLIRHAHQLFDVIPLTQMEAVGNLIDIKRTPAAICNAPVLGQLLGQRNQLPPDPGLGQGESEHLRVVNPLDPHLQPGFALRHLVLRNEYLVTSSVQSTAILQNPVTPYPLQVPVRNRHVPSFLLSFQYLLALTFQPLSLQPH